MSKQKKKTYLRLYLDIPNEESTTIVSKVLTLSREYTEEEKEEMFEDSTNTKENDDENEEKKKIKEYKENKQKYYSNCIHSMSILKDERLFSSSWDGTIKIYNKNNYYVDMTINAHNGQIK